MKRGVIYVKFHKLAFALLVIGGLNWLLQGLFNKDIFVLLNASMMSTVARIVYIVIGVAAISEAALHKRLCMMCSGKMGRM